MDESGRRTERGTSSKRQMTCIVRMTGSKTIQVVDDCSCRIRGRGVDVPGCVQMGVLARRYVGAVPIRPLA